MNCKVLTPGEITDWAACFPQELFMELMLQKEGLHALGVSFLEEAQGALVWGETVQGAEIRSLYIRPDARRLGLGSALLRCLWRELQKKQSDGAELLISYIEDGERSLLTPFLAESGFLMEQARFPQGEVTLAQLQETLLPRLGGARGNVKPLYQLLPKFQRICAQWLKEQLGAQLTPYLGKRPASFIFIEKDEVQGRCAVTGAGKCHQSGLLLCKGESAADSCVAFFTGNHASGDTLCAGYADKDDAFDTAGTETL